MRKLEKNSAHAEALKATPVAGKRIEVTSASKKNLGDYIACGKTPASDPRVNDTPASHTKDKTGVNSSTNEGGSRHNFASPGNVGGSSASERKLDDSFAPEVQVVVNSATGGGVEATTTTSSGRLAEKSASFARKRLKKVSSISDDRIKDAAAIKKIASNSHGKSTTSTNTLGSRVEDTCTISGGKLGEISTVGERLEETSAIRGKEEQYYGSDGRMEETSVSTKGKDEGRLGEPSAHGGKSKDASASVGQLEGTSISGGRLEDKAKMASEGSSDITPAVEKNSNSESGNRQKSYVR